MTNQHFTCQRCNTTIKLDESLLQLKPAQLKLVLSKTHKHFEDDQLLDDLDPQDFIPSDRLQLYMLVTNQEQKPTVYNSLLGSEDEDDDDDDDFEYQNEGIDNIDSDISSFFNSRSYVVLSDDEEASNTENTESRDDEDQANTSNIISTRIKMLQKIFEILSSHQQIDQPLSADCASLLIENYKAKFDQIQKEKDNYVNFLKKLKNHNISVDEEQQIDSKLNESIKMIDELTLKQRNDLEELKRLETVRLGLEKRLKSQKQELHELNKNQLNEVFKKKNKFQLDLNQKKYKLEQANATYKANLDHLDKLRNMNIYTKLFTITFNETYGSINGFRLGYKIVFLEINAGLGQIILLLLFLVKRLKLNLRQYKLVPLGSKSQIIKYSIVEQPQQTGSPRKVKTKTVLNLFTSNEFSLGRLFNFNKLDVSLLALLDIVHLLAEKLVTIDPEIEFPYIMNPTKGTVGGKSIRITSNQEWTDSCKFLLINLNWILAYTRVHTSPVDRNN